MHDINLLRPLIEQEQEVAKSRGRMSFYITFTIILLLLISSLIFGAKFYLNSESRSLDSKISTLEKEVSEVEKTEEKIKSFNETTNQIKNLDKTKISWSALYDNLAKSTPTDIKLNQVALAATTASSSAAATSPKLKITGEAKSRRAIALLADKLSRINGNFLSVEIISSQKTIPSQEEGVSQPEKIDFEINITLKI